MIKSSYSIFDFLKNCGGSWMSTIYVPCGSCPEPCQAAQRGVLLIADRDGRPRAISVARYEKITGQRVDPTDCMGSLTKSAVNHIFQDFALWECDEPDNCFLRYLDSKVSGLPTAEK